MALAEVRAAIAANDLDGLVRVVDALADAADWDLVVSARDLARRAFEDTGRQLWPAASWAEYRLALDGPDGLLGVVLQPDTGFLAPGPLAEVAAQRHRWASAGPALGSGPLAQLFAYECAARGEAITNPPAVVDLFATPLERAAWEPDYLAPTYRLSGVQAPPPDAPRGRSLDVVGGARRRRDEEALDLLHALRAVVAHWPLDEATSYDLAVVDGDAAAAIGALRGATTVRVAALAPGEALSWLAWAGADAAGARRRGLAAGRDAAWHALHALAGFDPHEPFDVAELGDALVELRWWWWGTSDATLGTTLRLAVEDPDDGIAVAIDVEVSVGPGRSG